ncbi:lytic murein transglycosylase B [Neisseriaceae bacterium ESL0693]|nr:lytic murein transglycosylase B [Neisseriaceae bacterium ESL0693]
MKLGGIILSAFILAACQSIQHGSAKSAKLETVAEPLALIAEENKEDSDDDVPGITDIDNGQSLIERNDVRRFINREAKRGHYTVAQLEAFFTEVQYKPAILKVMDAPSTSQPWYIFVSHNVSNERIKRGYAFWQKNQDVLNSIADHYEVPASLLVAIMGIETNYGANMGSYRVADALTTLSFHYPRRAVYFQHELVQFLQLAYEEQQDPLDFNGSFAGAMGMPQFMPSSFRHWAVDWDGDGHRDIWRNVGDTAASIAHYMKQHGWQKNAPIAVPVTLTLTPKLEDIIAEKTALRYTAGQLRQLGVEIPVNVDDREKGVLYQLETAPGVYEYWFGLNNFYTIWQYNHSRHYVAAVRAIAKGIASRSDL